MRLAVIFVVIVAVGASLWLFSGQSTPAAATPAVNVAPPAAASPSASKDESQAATPPADPQPLSVAFQKNSEKSYSWKSADVYRFDYSKIITIKQLDEEGKPTERVTEVTGFLICEIKSVTPAGALARLRIDSPRITLPEVYLYSSQFDDKQLQPKRNTAIASSIQGALKTAQWNVVLGDNGLVYIESRTPANLRDWLKETEQTAQWRRKSLDILPKLIEQDLGLKAPSHDRDILLYTGSAATPGTAPADPLRPPREVTGTEAGEETKQIISFARQVPADKTPYLIPGLLKEEKISAALKGVTNTSGKAIFDTQMNMIDTLNEDYTLQLQYDYGKLKLDQSVRVQYKLKRLAPPINHP